MKEITIKITKKHLNFLAHNNIYLSTDTKDKPWLKKGVKLKFKHRPLIEPYSAFFKGKNFFGIGSHSYSISSLPQDVTIGRYCAIGQNVSIIPPNHPLDRVSTSGMDYHNFHIYHDYLAKHGKTIKPIHPGEPKPMPAIGNDVWIGDSAALKRGITIGDGAVIGAFALVTKDVPAYAIVAGVPASVKKYRFNQDIINKFVTLKWWNYDFADFCELDTTKPEKFIADFEKLLVEGKIKKYQPKKINIAEELALI